jgi:hypothetical protein
MDSYCMARRPIQIPDRRPTRSNSSESPIMPVIGVSDSVERLTQFVVVVQRVVRRNGISRRPCCRASSGSLPEQDDSDLRGSPCHR